MTDAQIGLMVATPAIIGFHWFFIVWGLAGCGHAFSSCSIHRDRHRAVLWPIGGTGHDRWLPSCSRH